MKLIVWLNMAVLIMFVLGCADDSSQKEMLFEDKKIDTDHYNLPNPPPVLDQTKVEPEAKYHLTNSGFADANGLTKSLEAAYRRGDRQSQARDRRNNINKKESQSEEIFKKHDILNIEIGRAHV